MKLINPTDDELNAAFAEKLAGMKVETGEYFHEHPYLGRCMFGGSGPGVAYGEGTNNGGFQACQRFTESADAVLPWLEKRTWRGCSYRSPAGKHFSATVEVVDAELSLVKADSGKSFAHAAVIALLRAHDVEIEFTHA